MEALATRSILVSMLPQSGRDKAKLGAIMPEEDCLKKIEEDWPRRTRQAFD